MAKATRSRHRSQARRPAPNTASSQSHTDASSSLAQRDLLAAIFDAATEDSDLEKYLSQVVAHLGKYSKCNSIGVLLFGNDEVTSSVSCHGGATEFRRVPKASFPGSETCGCNAIAKAGSDSRPSYLTEGGAFFRNSKPAMSARRETPDGPSGLCVGATFESVALIPITNRKTAMGFIFAGDERKGRISPATVKFLERVGAYVGSTIRSFESLNKLRQLDQDSPGPTGTTATASRASYEMELVVRLIDAANESIVVSQDWRIIYVNNKCAEMVGISKQDMIGLAFLDITHPDDRPAVIERYSKLLSGEWLSDGITVRGFDKDGNTRWAELREIPFSWNGRPAIMSLVSDITDRKRAEGALALSEKKYRQLVETLDEGIVALDKDGKTVFVNPRMADMVGYTVEELTGKDLPSLVTLVTDRSSAGIAERKLESRRQGIRERYEADALRKDGTTIHLSVSASPILDDDGHYAGSIAAVQDITQQKKAEQALMDSERHYRFLADNTTDVIWITDLDLKPGYFSPSITGLTGYSVEEAMNGTLETRVTPASARAASEAFADALAREGQQPGSTKLKTIELELKRKDGSTVWVDTTVSLMRDSEARAIGVLGTMRDVTERRRAEEALKASEINYRSLFEHTLLGLEVVDMQTSKVVLSNRSMAEMFGFKSAADMVGTNPMDYVLPEDREWVASQMVQLMTEPGWHKVATLRSRTEDGRIIWITGLGAPIDYEGRPSMLLSLIDTTATKLAQDKLQESELKNRLLIENAAEGIVVLQDGLVKFANPKGAVLVGRSGEELTPTAFLDFIHPDDRQSIIDNHVKRLAGGDVPNNYTFRMIDKQGNTRWIQINAVRLDWEGRPAVLAMLTDITDRMKADEALKASEERFRTLIEESTDAIAILDAGGHLVYESPSMERVTGYKLEDWLGTPVGDWLLHPDDMAAMASLLEQLMGHPELTSEEVRVRFKHKDGTWHSLEGTVRNLLADPKVNGLVINYRDVTDRVKAEQALRESEERFRALAENSSDVIVLLNRNAVISYESPAAGRLLGLAPEERIGERPFDRVHPEDLPRATEAFGELMRNPGAGPRRIDELRLQHRDGSWRMTDVTGSAVVRDGDVEGIVVTLHDITDRKKAEEALKASEERFRTIIENAQDAISVLDENFSVIYESPSLARVTGYAPEDWIGKSPGDMDVHPDDVPLLVSKFELLRSKPGLVIEDVSVRYRHKDGSWHVVEASGRNLLHDPRVKGLVINFRDITARRRTEEALRESELRYRLLAENASDVIFTSDLAMKLTFVSPSVVQLTGRTPEEVMSLNLDGWIAPASREFVLKSSSRALDKAKSGIDLPPALRTATLEMLRKDGGTVWAEVRTDFLRDPGGQPIGIIGVARDITDRRMAELELEHRVQLEMLITEISTAFIGISTDYIDQGIQNALESISRFTEVDQSYLFRFSGDGTRMDMAHEWRSEGIKPLIGILDSVPVDSIPWFVAKVKQAECINIPELADLPEAADAERTLLRRQEVQSMIVVPMVQAGSAIGFLALGSIHSKKAWDQETIMPLRLAAEMFSNALERKRMDSALRESETRYRLLAENVTDVIWTTDMGLRVNYMSPSGVRLVGFSQEEYLDMTLEEMLTPSSFEDGMKAFAEQQAIRSAQQDTLPRSWTLEVQLRCKDGSTIWAEETVTFLRDQSGNAIGLLGVTRDIRERKRAEEALRLSEEKYRTLVEASPDGVLSIDSRGIITDCNTGLSRMLGYEKEELRGREAKQLGTTKDLDTETYYHAHLAQGEFMEVETEILRRDGQTLPVWAKLVRLAEPNTANIVTIIYFRDIADRRKIDEMKDEFVGLVSHELRSPLTVIIGALHTAISEGPRLSQRETRQLLEDAALEAEQLSHLVGNLLELSRAQANRLFLHLEPVNLAKAIHKVIESIERQSSKHKFIVDLPRKLPPVSADQLRLERILYNLLENGVKYSPEGSEITVSAKSAAGHLVVSVSDQGSGISKEDQPKLFKPFQQLGNPMLDPTKGAGLGLLVCRRLVEAHGGHIWVESEPNQGTTFHFTLEESTRNGLDAE